MSNPLEISHPLEITEIKSICGLLGPKVTSYKGTPEAGDCRLQATQIKGVSGGWKTGKLGNGLVYNHSISITTGITEKDYHHH